jgi:hypothetical protein
MDTYRYTPLRPRRHAIPLACQVVRERDFKLIADEISDLSEAGMLVVPKSRVLTGEKVFVSFMAPFSRYWIDLEATVARVVHGRRATDYRPAFALYFDSIDEVSRALLRKNLAGTPPPLPGRGRPRAPALA